MAKKKNKKHENKKEIKKENENKIENQEVKKDNKIEEQEVKEENKTEEKEIKKENKKELIEVKEPEKPKLVQELEETKKRNMYVIICISVLILIIGIFSIIFALMNVTKSVIVTGVSIKGIDVANLTIQEARTKLKEALTIELNDTIKIKSNDYETTLNTEQIEFEYNISKAIEDAYSIGRNGNIIQNNYAILGAFLNGVEIMPEYTYNQDSLNYIVDTIESKVPGLVEQASYYREDSTLIITPGKDGIMVEKEELKQDLINEILNKNAINIKNNSYESVVNIPIKNVAALPIDIDKVYSEVYTEPKDAYYEENPFKIYAEVDGIDFAISKDEAKGMVLEPSEEYRIPLKITPASKTINDIGTEAFPYLISDFTTRYDASNKNRSNNLALAAEKINGTVLMPGDEFSFNQVVGKRTIEAGYKDAKIYQDGKVVDGLAGGICQISSTLYNAVIQANLEIVERRNHSFTTSYVKAGRDATVVYGVIDFKFKNSRTYPIKIEGTVNSGIAEFKIFGIKEEVEYQVDLSPSVTASIPYATQYIPDSTLAPGQQYVIQEGHSGCKVTTYKETKLEGKLVSREIISTDTYQPMKAIIKVGP